MEQELNIDVKIISNETIKSTIPPSSPPKTFTLSLLDQIFPAFHIPLLLYYTPTPQTQVDILALKTSLSQTLDKFYPLAGRLLDDSTISCNNHGIPFVQTRVNSHLSHVMNSLNKLKFLTKFLPPPDLVALGPLSLELKKPKPISEIVPLAFQINVFLCGGVVIGCYMMHKFLDVSSLVSFLEHWSCLTSKRYNDLIQPDFESIIKAFPPFPMVEKVFVPPQLSIDTSFIEKSHSKIVAKSFKFNSLTLSKLKAKAASEEVPRPSRFKALAGFVWEQALVAAYAATNARFEKTKLSFSVNMRPRMREPLPKESIGNLVTLAHTKADAETSKIQDLVKEIHKSLSEINEKIKKVYEGENGGEVICQEVNSESLNLMENKEGVYRITSWCNFGLSDVDFGLGKPVWITPTSSNEFPPMFKNFIMFTDYSDGIEVWIFLEEKEMHMLEYNHHFLEFASPN